MEALFGFAGVAIGAVFGLVPRYWDRKDARLQREEAESRARYDEEVRRDSIAAASLLKCARTSNEFLASWQHFDDLGGGVEARDELRDCHERAAEMKTAWTEALVVERNEDRRMVIKQMLAETSKLTSDPGELEQLAAAAETSLSRLLGTDKVT